MLYRLERLTQLPHFGHSDPAERLGLSSPEGQVNPGSRCLGCMAGKRPTRSCATRLLHLLAVAIGWRRREDQQRR